MGAGQSVDGDKELARGLARRAFSKEHGRDPTGEEEERMAAAYERDDPTDAHLGTVTAEEADACREIARISFKTVENREPTGNELSRGPIDILARRLRRAALEAVEPDIETARRELVRRAVEAEKASGEVVPFGPPPRPADEGAAAGPAELPRLEREARAEHEKVRVIAAVTHAACSSTKSELKELKSGRDNLLSLAEDDKKWDLKVKTCGDYLAKLGAETRELHTAAADRAIAESSHSRPYATELESTCRDAYANLQHGGSLDYPSLSSDDAADIGLDYENVPWEDLEDYDPVEFDNLIECSLIAERQTIIEAIHAAALAKRERDAAAELKEREAQSRAAEADLLAQLDAEAGAAPKKKKKKKKKTKAASRSQSPATLDAVAPEAAAPAPAPVAEDEAPAESPAVADDWETAADAGAAPAPLEEKAAAPAEEAVAPAEEAAAPAPAATDAPQEPNAWKTPAAAETTAEAPAPAEEDAWETVGRRPRRASDAAPAAPVRRRGTVINVNKAEGYCFVQPDAGGTNVFLSFKERYAQEGDRIEYELVPSGRPERHAVKAGRAVNLSRATEARAPDWWCAACETNNFAARPACRRCGAARSAAAPKDEAPVPEGRFTGVVVGSWRGCYFLRGEDGSEDLLLHADDLDAGRPTRVDLSAPPDNAILAVGDRVCYALARARYPDRLAYYRLKCVDVSRAPPVVPDAPPSPPPAPAPPADPGLLADEPLDPPVARLLASLGLESVGPVLMREEIDWESLCLLDTDSLVDCGVDAADARRICERVDLVKSGAAPVRAASDPERECPICFEPERSTALVPCGHILCRACAAAHESCPVCRAAVTSRLRLFH
jgi:cold shock CspA family protein